LALYGPGPRIVLSGIDYEDDHMLAWVGDEVAIGVLFDDRGRLDWKGIVTIRALNPWKRLRRLLHL
jgi:hypothetical protein